MGNQVNENTIIGQIVENQVVNKTTNITVNNIDLVNQAGQGNVLHIVKYRFFAIILAVLLFGGAATGGLVHYFDNLKHNENAPNQEVSFDNAPYDSGDDTVKRLSTSIAPGVGDVKLLDPDTDYVVNTSTMVIHDPGCSAVTEMAFANLKEIDSEDYQLVIDGGYELCKRCVGKE